MSSIVSLSSPFFGSVSSAKERRWISIRCGTSRGFLSREKLLRVTGAALERAKVGDSSEVQRDGCTARFSDGCTARIAGSRAQRRATVKNNTRAVRTSSVKTFSRLLQLYRRPRLLKLALQFIGLVTLDAFLDRLRRLVHEGLGLLEAEPGR